LRGSRPQSEGSDPTPESAPLRLSVVVVTANRREELLISLRSLEEQGAPFELVVVDNGSSDGSVASVRQEWPDSVIVALSENAGVAGGRNRGIEAASGDLLVFLDDDASFEAPDALSRIRARFEGDPSLGVLTAQARLFPSGEPDRAAIPRREKRVADSDCAVSYFCGVAFAARRDMLAITGTFPEDFIYYCEELDLAWRVIEAGYRIVWACDLVVLHRRSALARPPGRWVYSNMRNRVRVALKYLPWRYVLSYAVLWWTWMFLYSVRRRFVADFARGLRDFAALVPATYAERRPLKRATLERIKQLDGRLLY
jgi:GT2 family glycosyltransferase